jgi:hypothetical protein
MKMFKNKRKEGSANRAHLSSNDATERYARKHQVSSEEARTLMSQGESRAALEAAAAKLRKR